jgi:NDP-sugar pyrophosphorylase family protein
MFCFGCTGGQHRSVYSAQHLAEHLNQKYGIEVDITHREQGIHTILPARRKAMIFAAGMGTRLKPLTDHMPKALVEISGKPLIEHVLRKLVFAGFNDITINVHHFADMIEQWTQNFHKINEFSEVDIKLNISDERHELLETGGAIAHARNLLTEANPSKKVLIHNVDILSNVNLSEFNKFFDNTSVDACLLVSARKTARYFVFNDDMRLVGWTNISTGEIKSPFDEVHKSLARRPQDALDVDNLHLRAFSGIHLINTDIINSMSSWPKKFSITDFYLNACKDIVITGYEQADLKLMDVGKLNTIQEAEQFIF